MVLRQVPPGRMSENDSIPVHAPDVSIIGTTGNQLRNVGCPCESTIYDPRPPDF